MRKHLLLSAALSSIIGTLILPQPIRGQKQEESPPTAAVEARVITDSSGCPVSVEFWLLRTPDTIAGIEAALTWDRPDVAHFVRAEVPAPKPDSARTQADSIAAFLLPSGNTAELDCSGGFLADWGFREARLRTSSSAKVIAVADFMRPDGATPIPAGAAGLLFRLPLTLQRTPVGAPAHDSLVLFLDPQQLRMADKRGDIIDVAPPSQVRLSLRDCSAIRSGP